MPEQAYKRCGKCGETKPIDCFYRDKSKRDGRHGSCKECRDAQKRAWVEANPERNRRSAKRRMQHWREANPDRALESAQRHRERHPEKYRARLILGNAVHQGKLAKPDRCEDCAEPTKSRDLHGHHADYSKPLDVEWLCPTCHEARHKD